jgi:hypothetical protein
MIRIRILIFYPSRIPDPGAKKAPDPGSGTLGFSKFCFRPGSGYGMDPDSAKRKSWNQILNTIHSTTGEISASTTRAF